MRFILLKLLGANAFAEYVDGMFQEQSTKINVYFAERDAQVSSLSAQVARLTERLEDLEQENNKNK